MRNQLSVPGLVMTFAAVLLGVCGQEMARGQAQQPPAPGLLFHASFDTDGYDVVAPDSYKKYGYEGEPGLYPAADYAAGSKYPLILQGDVEPLKNGKDGQAVHVPAGSLLTFDALGNIKTRRGTMAFWVRLDSDLWSKPYRGGRHPRLVLVSDFQMSMRGFEFINSGINSVNKRIELGAYSSGRWNWSPSKEWQAGQWHHVTFTWNEKGKKLYHNGKMVAQRDRPEHRFYSLGHIGLASQGFTRFSLRQKLGMSFDEFYIFDYDLKQEAIQRLMEENQPPRSRPPTTEKDPQAEGAWLSAQFGLQSPEVPEIPANGLRWARVHTPEVEDVKKSEANPVDGKINTRWPGLPGRGYTDSGKQLTFRLAESDGPFNFVRLRGARPETADSHMRRKGFLGQLRSGQAANDGWSRALHDEALVQRVRFDKAKSPQKVVVKRRKGWISEIDFARLSPMDSGQVDLSGPQWHFSAAEAGARLGEAGDYVQAYFLHGDQQVLVGSEDAKTGVQEMQANQFVHLVTPPLKSDQMIDQLLMQMRVKGFSGPTHMTVQWFDPVTWNRVLGQYTVRFDGRPEGQTLRLLLEQLGVQLEKGRQLWLAVSFDKPGKIVLGSDGSRLAVGGDAASQDGKYYIKNLQRIVSGLYNYLSEPQPWRYGWLTQTHGDPPNPPGQTQTVDSILKICEHILHFDPDNDIAQSMYGWILQFQDKWSDEVAARYPDDPWAGRSEAQLIKRNLDVNLDASGPEWAVKGRALLKATRGYWEWWINARMVESSGEMGNGLNDDTDVAPGLVNYILISDPDNRFREATRILSDYTWEHTLKNGITKRQIDHVHAFEDGTNIQILLPLLYYGNPQYMERMMITSQMYDVLTGINPQGHRLLRSHTFSGDGVPPKDRPSLYQPWDRGWTWIFHPGRMLGWYNANPKVIRMLGQRVQTWLNHSKFPPPKHGSSRFYFGYGALMFKTEERVNQGWPQSTGAGLFESLYWLYEMTGQERWRKPVVMNLEAGVIPKYLAANDWLNWRELKPDKNVDQALLDDRRTGPYVRWQLTGKRKYRDAFIDGITDALVEAAKFRTLHTKVGASVDRVKIPQWLTVARMYLGGSASHAKRQPYHHHAVSWENADNDIARFVVEEDREHIKVLIYNFHEEARDIKMRVWQLGSGRYQVRAGSDLNDDEQIDDLWREWEKPLWRYQGIDLKVPSHQVFVVTIDQKEKFDWRVQDQPDLAIGPDRVILKNGEVNVLVSNIGGSASKKTVVQIVKDDQVLAEQPLPAMEPPKDLQPKHHLVNFEDLDLPDSAQVVIDPEQTMREITRVNNRLPIDEGVQK